MACVTMGLTQKKAVCRIYQESGEVLEWAAQRGVDATSLEVLKARLDGALAA